MMDENIENIKKVDEEKLVIEKDGKPVECEILFSFTNDDNGKTYIGYTDHSKNEKGEENIYAAAYFPEKEYDMLENVVSEWELDMVRYAINQIKESE